MSLTPVRDAIELTGDGERAILEAITKLKAAEEIATAHLVDPLKGHVVSDLVHCRRVMSGLRHVMALRYAELHPHDDGTPKLPPPEDHFGQAAEAAVMALSERQVRQSTATVKTPRKAGSKVKKGRAAS